MPGSVERSKNTKNNVKVLGAIWRVRLLGPHPVGLSPSKEPPFLEGSLLPFPQWDTCDAPVAPLEAPVQGSGLGCSRPGCSTGIAGRPRDRLGGPGTLSPIFRGTLSTLITFPAVPHMPLGLSLGLLLVELEKGGD